MYNRQAIVASNVAFTPGGGIVATDVQAAIEEVEAVAGITSVPGSGQYEVVGFRLDADKKIVVTYDETAIP